MKAEILDITGKEKSKIDLPNCFSQKIRKDILNKVLEAKKTKQPYSPSPVAGKQHSAKGKVVHRRHVWRSGYGRGASRVPRKIFSQKGSQFNWEAAEVPFARGGMRAHPPKVLSMINSRKMNKKEERIAFISALSATASENIMAKKYERLDKKDIKHAPIIVENNLLTLKTKDLLSSLKKILGEALYEIAMKKKTIRAGKGKLRGRKYKSTAGMLLVVGKDEKLKTKTFEVVNIKNLGVNDLAKGSPGRITIYTESAIEFLENKFKDEKIK